MSDTQRPRIGIIGTGAIGGFYGLMLARAGFDVHFLLRSEYAAVAERGLQVNSAVHGVLNLHPVQAYRRVEDMPACDWLLVGAKTTSNAELAPLIIQAAAEGAKVVLLQNGLGAEQALRALLPESLHLLGGLCFICVSRSAPGVVEHQSQGMIHLGYHSGPAQTAEQQQQVAEQGASLFRDSGIDGRAVPSLEQARWHKLVWNIPYNGLSVLLNAGTTELMAQTESRALIEAVMNEVVQGAAACGHVLPAELVGKMLAGTQRMHDYLPSMYQDFIHRRALELPALYAEPLDAAQRNGVDMPRIRALYQALSFLDARNRA
jgi:2-dehydropantoate 2-reductase